MFDDMAAIIQANKVYVSELFPKGRKANILVIFISKSYFKCLKRSD